MYVFAMKWALLQTNKKIDIITNRVYDINKLIIKDGRQIP